MRTKKNLMVGKELEIFLSRPDSHTQVKSVKLTDKHIQSEADFIRLLQKVMGNSDEGIYTAYYDNDLFARFNFDNKELSLHKWSENTGVIMPCWNYFKE